MTGKTTGGTTEDMTLAVALSNKPALRAALAGMPRTSGAEKEVNGFDIGD